MYNSLIFNVANMLLNYGQILTLIPSIFLLIFFISYKWVKRFFDSYWLYLIIGLIGSFYFILLRWTPDIQELIDNGGIDKVCYLIQNGFNQIDNSVLISKALLLDMCPFMCLVMSVAFIFDKKRVFVRIIAPWCIFGGIITIYGGILFDFDNGNPPGFKNIWQYIFLGTSQPNNRLYYIMHIYLLIFGITSFFACKRLDMSAFFFTCLFAAIYLCYVKIMVEITGVVSNATGMVEHDWYGNGEYGMVGEILQLPFPEIQLLGYFGVFLVVTLLVIVKSILCFDVNKRVPIFGKLWLKMFPFIYPLIVQCNLRNKMIKMKIYRKFTFLFKRKVVIDKNILKSKVVINHHYKKYKDISASKEAHK